MSDCVRVSQLIYTEIYLTEFFMIGILVLNGLTV